MLPVLVELEHVVNLMQQAVGPDGVAGEVAAAETGGSRLFVPDAFTNAEYVRYALKGTLAVMICYTLQNAVNWPGIRTCVITCLIVGLGSEGASVQKGTLRIAGAVVGAAMGFLAILLLIPSMESITSLTLGGRRRHGSRGVGGGRQPAHLVRRRADRLCLLRVRHPGLRADLALLHHPRPPGGDPARQRGDHAGLPIRLAGAGVRRHVEESRLSSSRHGTARHGRQPERRSDGGRRANRESACASRR